VNCTVAAYTLRLLQAYTRLRTECCPNRDYPTLSELRGAADIIKQCYFGIITMLEDEGCYNFVENTDRPAAPVGGECQLGQKDWLLSLAEWAEAITCSVEPAIECWDLQDKYWSPREVGYTDCVCDASRTWESFFGGDPINIGPYDFAVEIYAGTDVTVDDDLVIGGVIVEPGLYSGITCPSCNTMHTFREGKILAMLGAGATASITVCDQQGWNISGYGTICVRRYV